MMTRAKKVAERSRSRHAGRIGALILLAALAASGQTRPQPPQIVASFPNAPGSHYPFRQNMYRVLQLPDGRIIALSIARRSDGQQTMQGRYSTDDGRHWTAPVNLFRWPKAAGGFALFDALVDQRGEIDIFILCDANSGTLFPKSEEGPATRPGEILDIWFVRSRDGRTSWDAPKAIWHGHGDDLLSVIQLKDGRLLLPFSSAYNRSWGGNRGGGFWDYTYSGSYSVSAIYSDDYGATWHQSSSHLWVETPALDDYGANEPVVIQLNDGRVWLLLRTELGRFYQSFSSDGGATWSRPRPSRLISSDSPAGLLRLKDGSLLLFSNACARFPYANGGRVALHVAISKDDGASWHGFREVARDPYRNEPPPPNADYGLAYTFPTLLEDGKVLFTNWVETGPERDFRLLDPAWVMETRRADDFSHGLDGWSVYGSKGVELTADPLRAGANVLAIRKADPDWPAGAVWNYPIGSRGRLRMEIMLRPGFGGTLLGLTNYFSVPWDTQDGFYNVFDMPIGRDGKLAGRTLAPGRWHKVTLEWDMSRGTCEVTIDGHAAGAIRENRRAAGVNYLRLRSTAVRPDGGLLIRSVSAETNGVEVLGEQ